MSQDLTIHVIVNTKNGDLTIAPSVAHLAHGARVQWKLFTTEDVHATQRTPVDEGELVVSFRAAAPFGERDANAGMQLRSKGHATRVVAASRPGVHEYQVAATHKGRIFADFHCPTIIIDRANN